MFRAMQVFLNRFQLCLIITTPPHPFRPVPLSSQPVLPGTQQCTQPVSCAVSLIEFRRGRRLENISAASRKKSKRYCNNEIGEDILKRNGDFGTLPDYRYDTACTIRDIDSLDGEKGARAILAHVALSWNYAIDAEKFIRPEKFIDSAERRTLGGIERPIVRRERM